MKPRLPPVEIVTPYLERMSINGVFSNRGPLVQEVESRLAEALSFEPANVVLCASATAGLTGVAALLDEHEFVVPAFTFAATPLSVMHAGKSLKFCDIDPVTWHARFPPSIAGNEKIGKILVLPFGSSRFPSLEEVRGSVIIDAAASLGSLVGRPLELVDRMTVVFSLHATKILGVGEGGVVVFGDSSLADRFRRWINFGFSSERCSLEAGTNAKMSEVQAAYALATLDQAEIELSEWRAAHVNANRIGQRFSLRALAIGEDDVSPYWIAEFSSPIEKLEVQAALSATGIESRDWWGEGCHRMPAFHSTPLTTPLQITAAISSRTLGLPIWRGMPLQSFEEIESVLESYVLG